MIDKEYLPIDKFKEAMNIRKITNDIKYELYEYYSQYSFYYERNGNTNIRNITKIKEIS